MRAPAPQAAAEPTTSPAPPRRLRSPVWFGVGEWALYLGAGLSLLWPVTLQPTTSFVGAGDAEHYVWQGWRLAGLIRTGEILSMRVPDVVWPYGGDLRLIDGVLPALVSGLWNLVAPAPLAYNLSLLAAALLNMWAGRRLARAITSERPAWVLTALAFGTAPPVTIRFFGHMHLAFAFAAPLIVAEAVRVVRGGLPVRPVRLGLLLFLAYLCSIYYLLFGALAYGVIVVVGRRPAVRDLLRAAAGGALLLVLMLPFLVPRLQLERAERAAGRDPVLLGDAFAFTPDSLSVAVQPPDATVELPGARLRERFSPNVVENTLFPGLLPLLAIGGLLLVRTRLRRPLLAAAGALWLLALGPSLRFDGSWVLDRADGSPVSWLPYRALLALPGLGSLRTPSRAGFTLAAVLTAGLVVCLGWLFGHVRRPGRRAALFAAAALMIVPNHKLVNAGSLEVTPQVERALVEISHRALPGESLLRIPADCVEPEHQTIKLQILHRAPVVGCQHTHSAIPWFSSLDLYARSAELAAVRCLQSYIGFRPAPFGEERFEVQDLEGLHRDLGVRFILVDKRMLYRPECEAVQAAVPVLRGAFRPLAEDDLWILFDVRGP